MSTPALRQRRSGLLSRWPGRDQQVGGIRGAQQSDQAGSLDVVEVVSG